MSATIRDVRLAALAESLSAFGSTLTREREFDENRWRSWAGTAAVFVATGDGVPCGMAVGVLGEPGAHRIRLWLTRGNAPARRLYESRGYVATGRAKDLPSAPEVIEDEMVLALVS